MWHYNSLKAEEYDESHHQGGEAQEITAGIYDGRQFDVGWEVGHHRYGARVLVTAVIVRIVIPRSVCKAKAGGIVCKYIDFI